jgi:hypothetical protein
MKSMLGYADTQDRRRGILSFGMTIVLYGFILGMSLLYGVLHPQEQIFSNMTVMVSLPGPVAPEPGLGSLRSSEVGEAAPAPKPVQQAAAAQPPAPAKAEDKAYVPSQTPVAQAPASTPTAVTPLPAATSASAPVPADSTQTTVAEPWVPGERGPGSRQENASSSVYVPGQGLVPWTGGVTIHKVEKGSASDTYLGGAQGTVGHSIYVPIYYSLPLPRTLQPSVYNAIPDLIDPPKTVIWSALDRKRALSIYYEFDGSSYRLKKDIPLEQREPFWQMLEDAGFNPAQTDYRQGKTLNPVVIGFTVTKDRLLKGTDILQSSGDPEIDAALLYGFKRASFYNKTGETVPGRFIYRF